MKTMAALSAKEFLEDGGSPGWNLFVGKELPADLQSGFRGVDADDAGEQAEIVDVPGPGGEGPSSRRYGVMMPRSPGGQDDRTHGAYPGRPCLKCRRWPAR